MLFIALIDDKKYGMDQIEELYTNEEHTLKYFSSFREFSESGEKFDVVYLDYYLENDGTTGDQILSEVKLRAKKVVAFSSVPRCGRLLKELGADEALVKE
ncbi:hypothetical protein HZA38_01425 [Candidatus Peregrinibacteria bacterium]|nr:hypothetical protein [Candidatus Peregrinibacteria bacterium]